MASTINYLQQQFDLTISEWRREHLAMENYKSRGNLYEQEKSQDRMKELGIRAIFIQDNIGQEISKIVRPG